ncbi:MAG TPA: diaminopimelate epimerase [Lachnospiraceae bacterium]|nr:diaminopimelate epimerase [Lachnospiraceae bacterium]
MKITMSKYQGLGNDYLVIDPNLNDIELDERTIEMICDRNFGAGSDGILYGPMMMGDTIGVKIYNPDGSEAEKSGNGVRIFGKYLLDKGYVKKSPVELSTLGGMVEIEYLNMRGTEIRANMGQVSFASGKIPVTGDNREIISESMIFHDRLYNTTCVSVGNPHCVIMMEKVTKEDALEIGPYVENSPNFPKRINMQLCHVIDRSNIEIEIYERGAGYTLASGTSACAAAAAAHKMGLADSKVSVHMPGGILDIEINQDQTVSMTGSVQYIGDISLAEEFFEEKVS